MNGPDRYRTLQGSAPGRAGEEYLGSVEGIDPVTGLPVLIYDFDGEPLASPGDLESDNIPRILWSGSEEGRGRVVSALSPGWERFGEDSGPLTLGQLLGLTAALRTAAAADVPHGDLDPRRLLQAGNRLQLEGYGVPWRPQPGQFRAPEVTDTGTLAGDVWSLAKIAEQVGLEGGDETVAAVLEQCVAADPEDRPSAEELYLALEALVAAGTAGGTPAARAEKEGRDEPVATATRTPEHRSAGQGGTPVPASADTGKGAATQPSPAPVRSDVQPEEPGERRRRLTLLGALMAGVVILALLALYGPRGGKPPAAAPLEDVVYVVEVEVSPGDLPPVTIHLISSPQDSSLARRDTIGTAPRHLALDRPGTWAFQGSLQGQRSEVVEIEVPEERTVTLVMPQ